MTKEQIQAALDALCGSWGIVYNDRGVWRVGYYESADLTEKVEKIILVLEQALKEKETALPQVNVSEVRIAVKTFLREHYREYIKDSPLLLVVADHILDHLVSQGYLRQKEANNG